MIKLVQTLRALNIKTFSDRSYDAQRNARINLEGITHYVDLDTLRYFKARIVKAFDSCHGSIFFLVESVAKNPDNSERGFRFVLFDVFGVVVNPRDTYYTTSDKAKKAGYSFLETFDLMAHYRKAIAGKAKAVEREHAALVVALCELA